MNSSNAASSGIRTPSIAPTSVGSLSVCTVNGLPAAFPVRLYAMIEECDRAGLSNVISWQPHGRCFLVHERDNFIRNILPAWFTMSHFASFQRQLNIYGFQRVTKGPEKGAYHHPCFIRGEPIQVHMIQRQRLKGQGPRRPDSEVPAPDFWAVGRSLAQVNLQSQRQQFGSSNTLLSSHSCGDRSSLISNSAYPSFPVSTDGHDFLVNKAKAAPTRIEQSRSLNDSKKESYLGNKEEWEDLQRLFDYFLEDGTAFNEAKNSSDSQHYVQTNLDRNNASIHKMPIHFIHVTDLEPTPLPPKQRYHY